MKKQSIVLFVTIFLFILLFGAGTYAYWVWASNVNKNVNFSTANIGDYVVYDEGLSYFVGNFQPASDYCSGINTTISFYKKSGAENVGLKATINMDVNEIGVNTAASSDVYWVLTSGDNSSCTGVLSDALSYGTFTGVQNGDVIPLLSDIEVTTTEEEYTVWIWIDESGTDLSLLSGENIDTNIWTQIS